jgi:hypothetical protein
LVEGVTQLIQIYYKDEQKEKLFQFSTPYFNRDLTIFFENKIIADLVTATDSEKVGVCSWKLAQKLRSRVGLRTPLTVEALNSDYDVLSFTRNSKKHTMLAHLYHWHPKSKEAMALLWQKLGYKLPGEVKNPIYQNHYVAKSSIYKDYVLNFLSPAMELISTDEELNNLMLQPSGYGKLSRENDLRSVRDKLGMSDYPLAPFILERCPSCWMDMKKINVTYL